MDLKSALAIVAPFSNAKQSKVYQHHGEHMVRLSPGFICATNRVSGCTVKVESITIEAAVPLRDLRKIIGVVENPVLKVKRSTLHITGGGSTFRLKCFPKANLLPYPDAPDSSAWKAVDAGILNSLSAIARVVDMSNIGNPMQAVRITPAWAAAATQSMLVTVRADFGTCQVTAHPEAVMGLSGSTQGGAICVDANRLWVADTATGQVRWSQALATPWPDSVVDTMLPQTKAKKDRRKFICAISSLKGLTDRSKLLMTGDEYGKIFINSNATSASKSDLQIEGEFSRGSFSGLISVAGSEQVDPVGISPSRLGNVLEAVGTASDACDLGDNVEISFGAGGGSSDPIVLGVSSSDREIDALLMPVILP